MRLIDADLMIVNGFKNKTIEVRTEDIIENHEKVVKLLFRDAIDFINKQPTVDAVKVVRCKECRWGKEACGNIECFVDNNMPPEYHGYEWFCPKGDKRSK